MHPDRVRFLKTGPLGDGPVIYWMSRDQRSRDNWALWYAQTTALEMKSPLLVDISKNKTPEYLRGNC